MRAHFIPMNWSPQKENLRRRFGASTARRFTHRSNSPRPISRCINSFALYLDRLPIASDNSVPESKLSKTSYIHKNPSFALKYLSLFLDSYCARRKSKGAAQTRFIVG